MDQALKSRDMRSASARRRKFQEREEQKAYEEERFQEHKRRMLIYDHIPEDMEQAHDTSDELDLDAGRSDRESSVETLSERSALTPDGICLNRVTSGQPTLFETHAMSPSKTYMEEEQEDDIRTTLDDDRVTILPPSPRPVLEASLATLSDFRYDRYSIYSESLLTEILGPEIDDDDETPSPVEVATPVSFSQPKSRPSLISISSMSQQNKRRTPSLQSSSSEPMTQLAERPAKRRSTSSSYTEFPAAEATLLEIPDLPANASILISNASQESLLLPSRASTRPKGDRTSSLPLLSTAFNHARMSSIKNLIKTPTSASENRPFSRSSSHITRPSIAIQAGTGPATDTDTQWRSTPSAESRNPNHLQRPSTAISISSSRSSAIITALPSLPTRPAEESMADAPAPAESSTDRKKSFSAFRRRSESVGHAIKGFRKISRKHDVPLPSPSSAMTPTLKKQPSVDPSRNPTPPLPSPHTDSASARASSSASTLKEGSPGDIGLGLRSVDGLSQT
ncbi:hypothetical protein A1O1_02005 [Capronia coronata CBS 617.96]|uniref:Uncharacterized protein n=1 Tax=Capronia coronata CBS 617.96 TaxID=1182541 RepID=W9YM25_9EURO|nr:uncharacterized protein A1O1_02005 [Capronia coronata CBS 617.96]EXJ93613.1 hypothetical protein A1O1_02005 [Capronia coronata CBS 617.96]